MADNNDKLIKSIDDSLSVTIDSMKKELAKISDSHIESLEAIVLTDKPSCDRLHQEAILANKAFKKLELGRKKITSVFDSHKQTIMEPEKSLKSAIDETKERLLAFTNDIKEEAVNAFEVVTSENDKVRSIIAVYGIYAKSAIELKNKAAKKLSPIFQNQLQILIENPDEDIVFGKGYNLCFDEESLLDLIDISIDKARSLCGDEGVALFSKYLNNGRFNKSAIQTDIDSEYVDIIETILGEKDDCECFIIDSRKESQEIKDKIETVVKSNVKQVFDKDYYVNLNIESEQVLSQEINIATFESEFKVSQSENDVDSSSNYESKETVVESEAGILNALERYMDTTGDVKQVEAALGFVFKYLSENNIEVDGISYRTEEKVYLR